MGYILRKTFLFFITLCFILSSPAFAERKPLETKDVPESLRSWIPWVLSDIDLKEFNNPCPYSYNNFNARTCSFPLSLEISADGKGFSFVEKVRIFDKSFVTIPGKKGQWVENVTVNGKKIAVVAKNSTPTVYFDKEGLYEIKGSILWDKMPDNVSIPYDVASVVLTVDNKKITNPDIDEGGRLWFSRKVEVPQSDVSDQLSLKTFRHIKDDIPMIMETIFIINISGKNREVVLSMPYVDGFTPVDISSQLPARIENNDTLRVQAKAGRWQISVTSKRDEPIHKLRLKNKEGGVFSNEEIWTFEAKNELRLVQVDGVSPIDPSQTDLPADKRRFPAYLVLDGNTMEFSEKNRGADENIPDQLTINRKWVMFLDGSGYLVKDTISGEINQSTRLEMQEGELGRVSIDGVDQMITRLDKETLPGVEVRNGYINLSADIRIKDKNPSAIDVAGWKHDFTEISGTLMLPPGWTLFEAFGVDSVNPTWVGGWSLLDVFLVLVTSVAVYKLMGLQYGLLSLLTLVLVHPELHDITWYSLLFIGVGTLDRFLPEGFFKRLTLSAKKLLCLLIIISSASFALNHLRQGVYPSVFGFSYSGMYDYGSYLYDSGIGRGGSGSYGEEEMAYQKNDKYLSHRRKSIRNELSFEAADSMISSGREIMQAPTAAPMVMNKTYNMQNMLPGANIQTGFGVSEWQGRQIYLRWNGMVESGHKLKLILISAKMNMLLSFLRVFLLAIFIVMLMFSPTKVKETADFVLEKTFRGASRIAVLALMFLVLGTSYAQAQPTEYPSREMLEDLKAKVIPEKEKLPECFPDCTKLSRTHISAINNRIVIRSEYNILGNDGAKVTVPLPALVKNWRPETIVVNGVVSTAFNSGGYISAVVETGINDVVMEGALPNAELVQLSFPIEVSKVTYNVEGWVVNGVRDDGTADPTIQLLRVKKEKIKEKEEEEEEEEVLSSDNLPPFVMVERNIDLGISWTVTTTTKLMNPSKSSAVIDIPLLDGESVTTSGLTAEAGVMKVNLSSRMPSVSWTSVLKEKSLIKLEVPEKSPFIETWKISAGNIWHVEASGIPRINDGTQSLLFRPWTKEKLTVFVSKPEAVSGQIKTIDRAKYTINQGERNLKSTLDFTLRSSLGGQHKVVLPKGAKTPSVVINGSKQALRQENDAVIFPVIPGSQSVKIEWTEPFEKQFLFKAPIVDVGAPMVNIVTSIETLRNRWILMAGGTPVKPAVLFWGVLPIVIILSFGLGLYPSTIPLKAMHWFLLLLGLSQTHMVAAATVIVWFLAFNRRYENSETKSIYKFNARQLFLVALTIFAGIAMISGIGGGLLGQPDMKITGFGSSSHILNWYQDIAENLLPKVWFVSLPLFVWRGLMLLWALWLAFGVVKWVKWAFVCFSKDGIWHKKPPEQAAKEEKPKL